MLRIAIAALSLILLAPACLAEDAAPAPLLRETMAVPVAVEPTAADLDWSGTKEWHRVTAKLVGSMCPACLIGLEEKLKKFDGVKFVKVDRDPHQGKTTAPRVASLTVVFDTSAVKFTGLQECIKKELYKSSDVKDVVIAKLQ